MGKELPDVVQPAEAPSPTAQATVPSDANAAILLPARLDNKTPVCIKTSKTTGKTSRYAHAHAHIRGAKPRDGQPSSSEHTSSHSSSSSDGSDEEGGRAVAPLLVPVVSDAMQVLCLRTDCTLMAPHAVPQHRMLTYADVC
jgi:hypothetical protein